MTPPPPRRTFVAVLSGALALVSLAGCTKPTPGVTLVSDGKHVRSEATVFCRGDQTPAKRNCATSGHGPAVIPVRQGGQVGVDVDKTLAQHGWYLVDVDGKQRTPVQDTHYFSFQVDFSGRPTGGVATYEVRSVDHVAENAKDTGTWLFQFTQR